MTAARVRAVKHVVNAHQIVTRLGEFRAQIIIHALRRRFFLRTPQPANLKFSRLAAFRTLIGRAFHLLLLSVKVSFIHSTDSLRLICAESKKPEGESGGRRQPVTFAFRPVLKPIYLTLPISLRMEGVKTIRMMLATMVTPATL